MWRTACRAACLVAMLAIGGCSLWGEEDPAVECQSEEEYQQARGVAAITIPPGLDQPDESTRLAIPAGPLSDKPLSAQVACLQQPPSFFDKPLAVPADD